MAILNVNPTRMQLSKLKKQLTTAVRGHKMLKDKRDELMRQFLDLIRETRDLREKVEAELEHCNAHFVNASAVMSKEALDAALLSPKQQIGVQIGSKNVMSVEIPQFETETRTADKGDIFPYGFAFTSFELDDAVTSLDTVLPDLIKLAQYEKSCELMSAEIEKTRRRVNALEYVMIPQLEITIRYIRMKLDEDESGNLTRLMKVKDMVLQDAHGYQ